MAGTLAGGKAASETNKLKYGENFYKDIGRMGGKKKTDLPKGFAYMKATGNTEKIREAGRKGGEISRRGKVDAS